MGIALSPHFFSMFCCLCLCLCMCLCLCCPCPCPCPCPCLRCGSTGAPRLCSLSASRRGQEEVVRGQYASPALQTAIPSAIHSAVRPNPLPHGHEPKVRPPPPMPWPARDAGRASGPADTTPRARTHRTALAPASGGVVAAGQSPGPCPDASCSFSAPKIPLTPHPNPHNRLRKAMGCHDGCTLSLHLCRRLMSRGCALPTDGDVLQSLCTI